MLRPTLAVAVLAMGLTCAAASAQPVAPPEGQDRPMMHGPMMQGPMQHHGHRWMGGGRMGWQAPDCRDRYARTIGRLAYLEARLELTAEQRPLWDKWQEAVKAGAGKQRDLCRQFAAETQPASIVERQGRLGQIVAARAEALQTAQPALAALYQALNPEQKAVLDRPPGEGFRRP